MGLMCEMVFIIHLAGMYDIEASVEPSNLIHLITVR